MKKNKIELFFHFLLELYGNPGWWPSDSGSLWEIAAGAVLTQNTAWSNVEKALNGLKENHLETPADILAAELTTLQEIIRPAGFYQQKSCYLKNLAGFYIRNEKRLAGNCDFMSLRKELLSVKGVGRETADDILLYAFRKPVFIIDAYTRRVAQRHLDMDGTMPYDRLQKAFMDNLSGNDAEFYGLYHALIVHHCKVSCLKRACGENCHKFL